MLIAAPTPVNTIFWQWANQTVNAGLNYGNRNASSTYTNEDIMKSYALACVSSIIIALSIRKGLSRYTNKMSGAKLIMANSVSTFAASATAGFMNAFIMRRTEMETGIDIYEDIN